jgi:hypothetical protein
MHSGRLPGSRTSHSSGWRTKPLKGLSRRPPAVAAVGQPEIAVAAVVITAAIRCAGGHRRGDSHNGDNRPGTAIAGGCGRPLGCPDDSRRGMIRAGVSVTATAKMAPPPGGRHTDAGLIATSAAGWEGSYMGAKVPARNPSKSGLRCLHTACSQVTTAVGRSEFGRWALGREGASSRSPSAR